MARYSFIAAAAALSAVLALAVTSLSPVAPSGDAVVVGGAAERIEAAHAVVDDYLKMTADARLAADRAADAELAASRRRAAAEAAQRIAAAAAKPVKPVRVAAALPPEPAPAVLPVAPPLQLQAPPPAEPAVRKRPVISRVVATVGRVPDLVKSGVLNAASWVVDLPGQVVTHLPERRFL